MLESVAKPAARTMMGLDASAVAAAVSAATERAKAGAAPAPQAAAGSQLRQPARTMMGMAAAYLPPTQAAAPAAQPPHADAPAPDRSFAARTMLGVAAGALPAAPPQPTASDAVGGGPSSVDTKRTMIGGAGFSPVVPGAAPIASGAGPVAPARNSVPARGAAVPGRTMLGVPLADTAPDANPGQRDGDFDSFALSPGSEAPGPYVDEDEQNERPSRGNHDIETMSLRKPAARPVWVFVAIGVAVLLALGALFMRARSAQHAAVSARVVIIDAGEALLFEVQSAPAGSKLRFGGQEKALQAGRATFALAADSLRVGDNVVLADIVYPDGTTDPTRITLAVYYRIRVDTAALHADKSAVDVVVTALPGTRVTLDGEELKLDAEGRATRTYPIDVVGEAKGGVIDHIVHYRVQPPSGETVVDELHTPLPVAMMQIDRPGRDVVTDHSSIEISGVVPNKNTLVRVDGVSVAVNEQLRFIYSLSMPNPQTYRPRVVASAVGKAPMGVTLEIRRVADLAQAAAEFIADPELTYAKLAPNPSIYRGQKIAIEGRVYDAYTHGSESYFQIFARPCPSSQTCSVWVSDPAATALEQDDWVRVLGLADGEQQFRAKKNDQVVTVPKVQARFVLPAKP